MLHGLPSKYSTVQYGSHHRAGQKILNAFGKFDLFGKRIISTRLFPRWPSIRNRCTIGRTHMSSGWIFDIEGFGFTVLYDHDNYVIIPK
jgi:hypothetical protein